MKEKFSEIEKKNLVYEFLNIFFEKYQVSFKSKDLDKGTYLLQSRLDSFLNPEDKIIFLNQKYSELHSLDDDEIQLFQTFLGKGKPIPNWKEYFEIILLNSPSFIDTFFLRIKPVLEERKDLFHEANFFKFYNFYWDIISENSAYTDLNYVPYFLKTWSEFSQRNFKLKWITEKLEELQREETCDSIYSNLGDLFEDYSKYLSVIEQLKKNEIIDSNNSIIDQQNQGKKGKTKPTELQIIAGIGYLCSKKKYLKNHKKNQLAKALSNTFNKELSPSRYSQSIGGFSGAFPNHIKEDPVLSILDFI